MKRKTNKSLKKWEVAIVKSMLNRKYVPQDVHAYFSRPTRSVNQARISQIKDGTLYAATKPASDDDLNAFLNAWPDIDPVTGLHLKGDELLVKAREAMIAAVYTFNSAGLFFRAELFIVTSIIAWTYLMHAYYKKEGIDYRYKEAGVVKKTKHGADKYWELGQCLAHGDSPIEKGAINNLNFLIKIRHEIEHQSTNRIDDALSAKLQACCINFNDATKTLFGKEFGLEKRLPIALQFVIFDGGQRANLVGQDLPPSLEIAINDFHNNLSDEEQANPKFRFRTAFVPLLASKASKSDLAVEFVKAGTTEAENIEKFLIKETERPKLLPNEIVSKAKVAGFSDFEIYDHTQLVYLLDARNLAKGYGVFVAKKWHWYDSWFEKVIEKLNEGWTR